MKTMHLANKVITITTTISTIAEAEPIDPADDPQIAPGVKAFLHAVNSATGEPIEKLSPEDGRAVLNAVQSSIEIDSSSIEVSKKTIVADDEKILLHIVRPAGIEGVLPAFMFFHGGGWVLGDYPTHERLVRDLVMNSGAVAVFVNYTRSPEAKFPLAINQAYAATKWVAEHGAEIQVDGSKLAVAGNSVGGNMAAIVALMAEHKNGPKISFQLLMWPVTNADFETASYNQFAEKRFLTKSVMQYYWDSYIPDPLQRDNIYASPLLANQDQLKGLSPALIQTAENDVLRDEGEAYGRLLGESGVDVTVVRYNGMIHDFGLLNPLADIPAIKSAVLQAGAELKRRLK